MRRERQGESERAGGGCGQDKGETGGKRVSWALGVGTNHLILASCFCGWMEGWIGGRRKTLEGRLEGKEKERWRMAGKGG